MRQIDGPDVRTVWFWWRLFYDRIVHAVPFYRKLAQRAVRLHALHGFGDLVVEFLVAMFDGNGERLVEDGVADLLDRVTGLDGIENARQRRDDGIETGAVAEKRWRRTVWPSGASRLAS